MNTANDLTVLEATLWRPRAGRWMCEVSCDGDAALSGAVTLDLDGAIFKGTAKQAGAFQGRVGALVVGGAGRLHEELPSKYYRDVPVSVPLGDILAAVGETLAPSSEAAVTGRQLPKWTRTKGPATDALRALVDSVGATWRHLEDGTLWVGNETWPEQTLEHELLQELSSDAQAVIAPQKLELRPGVTFLGRHVEHVTHVLAPGKLRSEVHFTSSAVGGGRLRIALENIVRRMTAYTQYYGVYAARVVARNEDGTLELQPDDPRMPGLSQVPVRNGLPNARVNFDGTRVLVGFENGDPRAPYVSSWYPSDASPIPGAESTRVALGDDPKFVALAPFVDDVVQAIADVFNDHTHGTGVGPTTKPVPLIAPQPSVAAATFKA